MRISARPELGVMMTFELSKTMPIHSWFWYKEGYAPQIVEWLSREQRIGSGKTRETGHGTILDPFCGVGTTLLAAKGMGYDSLGVDASPLAAFVSSVKCASYSEQDLEDVEAFMARMKNIRPDERAMRSRWDFELFDTRAAFPRRNHQDILALRAAIEEESERCRDLLLLSLPSSLPQASLMLKDGGVLKIRRDKRAMPIREVMRRKLKAILRDLRESPVGGPMPKVSLGDARRMDMKGSSVDAVITSPPYLNNIDYSKIYGLELSLLEMSKAAASEMRMRAVRSFIRTGDPGSGSELPPEVGDIGARIPIIGTYFKDMEESIKEMHRVLKPGGVADIIVSNSVIHETHVLVDEILAEIGERIGFIESEVIVGAERIADVRPHKVKTRESVVVLRR